MNFLLAIFMLFSSVFALEPNTEFIVASTSCYVYTDSSFDSAKVQKEEQDLILHHGQKVSYQSEENDFYFVTVDEETEGYIYKYYLAQSGSSVSVYPTFNATIREDCPVLDEEGHATGLFLQKGQRAYLYNGFKSNEKRNPVQVVIDGQVYNGYVETKYISPDGVSATLIVAISAISAIVIVTLSLVFIKKRKKKKKK